MAHSILVIDGDAHSAHTTQSVLQAEGLDVHVTGTGMRGLVHAREHATDLALLDLTLPDMSAAEVLRRLRTVSDAAVIMITPGITTSRGSQSSGAGADEYIIKPIHARELCLKVRDQLAQRLNRNTLRFGPLELHLPQRRALLHGHELRLTPKEYDLLLALMRQPERVFSREELHQELWHRTTGIPTGALDAHLRNLRGKLRDLNGYGLLQTVRGTGFGFRKPRAALTPAEAAPDPLPRRTGLR